MNLNFEILQKISKESPSFYIADLEQFKNNYNKLLGTFRKYYKNTYIAYSYKTNYLPDFCKIVNQNAGFAEVVSSMEMQLALDIGVKYENIFFNGPIKDIKYVEKLLVNGGVVNIDSIYELNKIIELAANNSNKTLNIGLRLNFDVDDGVISRFGFDINGEDFITALNLIEKIQNINLVSLHGHFATRYLKTWINKTKGMLEVINKFFINNINNIKFISLGGALYGEMNEELKQYFNTDIPSFDDYAKVSAKIFNEFFSKFSNKPILIIEPGTALAANSMKYVTKVESIKQIKNKYIATLFGSSYNINPRADRKKVPLPIKVYSNNNHANFYEKIDLAGYTCIESDYLYFNYSGNLGIGDFVVFDEVGSYSIVMKPPFILPQVPIIFIKDNEYMILKEQETFNDIFKTYRI